MKSIIPLLFSGIVISTVALAEPKAPNILFILVDDQRNDTLGCAGHPVIKTPNIDQLAKHGVRFENAYVTTPICMSSRATIFTGMTETGHGYTGGGFPATPVQKMDVDTSFPTLLRNENYRSGFYGKQHVKFAEGNDTALKRMFDDYKVYGGGPHFVELPDGTKRHTADLIGDRSVEFIRSQPKDKPFCLYMSFNIAHARDGDHRPGIGHFPWPPAVDGMYEDIEPATPHLGDPKYFEMQPEFLKKSLNRKRWFWRWDTEKKYRINMRAYYRMLTGMDKIIGRVQAELEKQNLAENTVIIYTADNGFYMGERGFAGKWSHYEESLRVPLIIYDPRPESMPRGITVPLLALNLDLPATILDIANIATPTKYQGESLLKLLHGDTPKHWRTDFFTEFRSSNKQLPDWYGIHGERYTYANYHEQDPPVEMLYDLREDPQQLHNLAKDPIHQATLTKLHSKTKSYIQNYSRPEIMKIKEARR
ncbi:MAG: sulfatase [Akkermansiaceae bacterium]